MEWSSPTPPNGFSSGSFHQVKGQGISHPRNRPTLHLPERRQRLAHLAGLLCGPAARGGGGKSGAGGPLLRRHPIPPYALAMAIYLLSGRIHSSITTTGQYLHVRADDGSAVSYRYSLRNPILGRCPHPFDGLHPRITGIKATWPIVRPVIVGQAEVNFTGVRGRPRHLIAPSPRGWRGGHSKAQRIQEDSNPSSVTSPPWHPRGPQAAPTAWLYEAGGPVYMERSSRWRKCSHLQKNPGFPKSDG
jgi:hypothetical protein